MGFVKVSVSAYSRVFVSFCLIADFLVIASPPRIIKPTAEEIVVQSRESISLECEGEHFVNWTQKFEKDSDVSNDPIRQWSVRYVISEDAKYPFKARLDLRGASYLDTGYFYCTYNTIDYDDIQSVAKVYVYVNSSTELLALRRPWLSPDVYGEQGSQLILPCRPTSPNVTVILLHWDKQIYPPLEAVPAKKQWNYDPRKGFYLDFTPKQPFRNYTCNATAPYAKRSQTMEFLVFIRVKPDDDVPKPVIENATDFVMMGESVTLVCYVKVSFDTEVGLEWIPPNGIARQENRYRTESFSNPLSNQYKEPTVRVTINNAQKADEGEYICNATQGEKYRQTSIRVEVQDNSTPFIYLNVKPSITGNATFDAKWVVHIVAHPSPDTRKWQKPNGEVVNGSSGKFVIRDDPKSSMLKISDLHLDDWGVYVFTATNALTTVQRNLTLYVKDSPEVTFLKGGNDVLQISHVFSLTCTVKDYPKPSIKFLFRPCYPEWNCAPEFELLGTNKEKKPTEEMMDHLTVQFKTTGIATQSGEYVCIACNHGCRYDTQRVVVSDVPEGFQLTTATEFPAESDGVGVSCSVTLFKYKKEIQWFYVDENGKEYKFYVFCGSFHVFKSSSAESYTETLNTSSIKFSDSGSYTCQATDFKYNKYNATPVNLKVLAKVPPVILNVSHPEGIIETYEGDKVEIKCVATGVPQPKAEWLKDGVIFENFQTEGNTSFVTFEFVKEENAGHYVCRYWSSAGEQKRTFELRVKVNAEHKPVQHEIIVLVVLLVIVVVAILIFLFYKIREDKKREGVWNAKQLQDLLSGNIECMNPDLGIDEQAELLPYDKQWEFRRDHLTLGKQLGSGAFGRVLKGEAMGITTNEAITIVAVKMVKSHANYCAFETLLAELKIMIHLGSHLNVVNLLGACTANITKGELLVIVEYCKYGNLRDYLIKNRENFIDQIDPATGQLDPNIGLDQIQTFALTGKNSVSTNDSHDSAGSPNPFKSRNPLPVTTSPPSTMPVGECATSSGTEAAFSEDSTARSVGISSTGSQIHAPMMSNSKGDFRDTAGPLRTKDLICWSFQIARGMEYLASRKVLHGDLAARNILLAENNVVKICDFGLARELYKNYKKKSDGPLPVKWMAIESIKDLVFSTQSDVWSFGIVLWEMFSLGETPYPDLQADEVFFGKLKAGYRMERPTYASAEIYDVMMDCWRTDPCSRPSFTILQEMLGELLEESVRCHYIDLNSLYLVLNTERRKEDYVDMVGRPDYANVASAPSRTPGPCNANRSSTSHLGVSGMTPGVRNSSTGLAERLSMTGAGYLFMASPAKSQTPDVFSPKGNLPKSSVDLALKLPKVEEE